MSNFSRRGLLTGGLCVATLGLNACAIGRENRLGNHKGRIEWQRLGKGRPPIILVHGLGDDIKTWRSILKPLSTLSEAAAFNRPGYGQSAWEGIPRDAKTISDEIRFILHEAGYTSPVILAGHSLGGVYAQVYARRFPSEVAGLVLIDTTVPGQTALIRRLMPVQFAALPALLMQEPAATRREFERAEASENLIPSLPPYRNGPVEILAATRGDILSTAQYLDARREIMRTLAAQYAGNFHLIDSGHFIHQDNPSAVVDAIKRVLSAVKV